MVNWMLRGFVFAAAMIVVRLLQAVLINAWQGQSGLISVTLLMLFLAGVAVWGNRDGRTDAMANADPGRRQDLAMTWLLAGLIAGVVSGAVAWLVSRLYRGLYVGGLINELTTFAAFTALLVFMVGIIGVAVGRWQADRQGQKGPAAEPAQSPTDVFAAARTDQTPTGENDQPAAAITADRTEPATVVATESEAPTEVIRTDTEETKPEPEPTNN